jgi:hypothetical protein
VNVCSEVAGFWLFRGAPSRRRFDFDTVSRGSHRLAGLHRAITCRAGGKG